MQTLLHTPFFGVPVFSDTDWQTEWAARAADPHAIKTVDEGRWRQTRQKLDDTWRARQRFLPKSAIAKGGPQELLRALEFTRTLVTERGKPIYKPTFYQPLLDETQALGLAVRPDFLVADGESGWRVAEVVLGEITPADIFRLAAQVYVLEEQGLKINKASLIFHGAVATTPGELAKHDWQAMDQTVEVRAVMAQVRDQIALMRDHVAAHPLVVTPQDAERGAPEFPLYELLRINGKRDYTLQESLAELGVFDLRQISLTLPDLEVLHRRQIGVTQTGVPYVNEAGLTAGYAKYVWPVNYLDVETETYDMDTPQERHTLRQCSNRVVAEDGEEICHDHFLDLGKEDPALSFARWLVRSVNRHGHGTVVVFWEGFEIQRFNELAQKILQMAWRDVKNEDTEAAKEKAALARDVLEVIPRIFDQFKLLRDNVYFREQHGRFTIKVMQPLLVPRPELTYDDLPFIKNGLDATTTIIELVEGRITDAKEMADKIEALLVYCGVDTLAMKEIDREMLTRYVRKKVA